MQLIADGAFILENGEVFNIQSFNNLYVTKETREKKFKGKSFDFSKPVYESIPSNEENTQSVELSKEELNFINGKE